MKGIVFREFLDYAEGVFGLDVAENMISGSSLRSGGAYTAVGTYDHAELVQMLEKPTGLENTPTSGVLRRFGQHLFRRLAASYPEVVSHSDTAFRLLANVDTYVHVEVRKLYPDAELPAFVHELAGPDTVKLVYQPERGLADLAEGLPLDCIEYFRESVKIAREDLDGGTGKHVCFTLDRGRN